MNIRDLQYLVAVHDLRSFSKAAELCFVSQPTLSGQLKKLELELNATLMERSTRQVFFTQLGESVVEQAREILLSVEKIRDIARENSDPFVGDFHIGMIPTVGPFLLPLVMPALGFEFPKINFFLHELRTELLLEKLLKGSLDAAILAKLEWQDPVREIPLYEEALKLAVSDTDTLANRSGAVNKDVLEEREVMMLEDGHCLRDQTLGVCFSAGANEDRRFQATSMDTLLHMVASGLGITLIPELACKTQMAGIHYLTFDSPQPSRDIVMLTRKNSARIPALERLADVIAEAVRHGAPTA